MSAETVRSHRKEITELKTEFEGLQEEVNTKLKACAICINSAERLNREAETLVKNLQDSLANVSNDAKEWQQIKAKLASTAVNGKVILDVGGERYTTSVETLTREKNTFFTAMFSRQWKLERDPKDESIFIDRDGKLFADILGYLRTDFVPSETMTNETLRQKLLLEAQYFHLHKLIETLTEPDRNPPTFLNGGTLLSNEQRKFLFDFSDKTQKNSQLLYKATRDGFDANAFHNRCNNQGATITIIRSNNGYLFGGYTSVSWTSSGAYMPDDKAFLFTLTNPHNIPPTKYLLKPENRGHAVCHHTGHGPTFGSGHDLYICANSNTTAGSYTNFPHGYTDSTGQGNNTFTGNRNFLTADIEVFKLT